jgi:hypothetical protein
MDCRTKFHRSSYAPGRLRRVTFSHIQYVSVSGRDPDFHAQLHKSPEGSFPRRAGSVSRCSFTMCGYFIPLKALQALPTSFF